jgi:surface protein
LKNKKENLPGCICYNKAFFSSSLQKEIALRFMNYKILNGIPNNKERVLYIIKSGENLYDNTPSNVDIQQFSGFNEKEILFFPFSCFEVNKIEKNRDKYGEYNIIYLLYLGKYKEKISKKEKIGDSDLLKDFCQTTYVDVLELSKEPTKFVSDFTKYIPPKSKIGFITATYQITNKDLDKDIQILNCCISNKKELIEICDIYFEGEKKNFSFVYTFKYPGNYKFIFKFKKLLKNACKLFAGCKTLILIDLKDFKTNNIDNMSSMFEGCSLIESLDLSNFKTKEVVTMKNMFYDCKSLKNLDISSFKKL